jgi:glutathione S-transferase
VIAEYLDNRTPLAHLIPTDNSSKISVRRWEALADGVCDAAVAVMLEQRKPAELQDPAYIAKHMEKVTRGLAVLNMDLTRKKWCVNGAFSLADIAVGCLLGYLDLRFKSIDLQAEYPNLIKLYNELMKRESFKATLPVG